MILSAFLNSSDIQLEENVYFYGVNIDFEKVRATFSEMRAISTNFECVTQHGPNFKRMANHSFFNFLKMMTQHILATPPQNRFLARTVAIFTRFS